MRTSQIKFVQLLRMRNSDNLTPKLMCVYYCNLNDDYMSLIVNHIEFVILFDDYCDQFNQELINRIITELLSDF